MRRLGCFAAAVLMAIGFTGCAAMDVGSYVGRGVDLKPYRTYDWGPADALPTGDPRLDHNSFFKDHFEGAVEKQLAGKGYARDGAAPDLLIHYHASVTRRLDVDALDRQYGYCPSSGCEPRVVAYDAGTLVIDIVDARTQQLLWRGWAQQNLDGMIGDQDRLERVVNDAVSGMLARLPAHL
jgi:hypothetical protein